MRRTRTAGSRRLFKLSLGLAALLMVISLGVTIPGISRQHRMEALAQRISQSGIGQAWIETARLQALLQHYSADTITTEAIRAQFETLAADILMLGIDPLPALSPDGVAEPPMLQALLPVGQQLDRLLDGESNALPGLLSAIDLLEKQLRDADARLQPTGQDEVELTLRQELARHWAVPASTLGLLLAAGLLVALLRTESHRARCSRVQAEQAAALQQGAERTLRVLIDSLPVMVSAFDTEGRYLFMNEAHARFHQVQEAAAIGRRPAELGLVVGGLDRLPQALASGAPLPVSEGCFADRAGRQHSLLTTAAPVLEGDGKPAHVVLIAFDVTERKRAEDRLRHLAGHDPLTDLPNRVIFTNRLQELLARAKAEIAAGRPAGFALHCIDLDRFKEVNDSLGHPIGDRLLLAAAGRMRNCLAQVDLLARLGGDEFAVIQADATSPVEATRLANRLVRVLEAPFKIDGFTISAGASIGSVLAPQHGRSSQALQQQGDIALYRAKSEGRGRAVLFTPEMGAELAERRLLEAELRHVLEVDGLTLAYQPQFCLVTGRVLGCEALLRWNHPERGAIPPARFVPLAEEAGLATALSRWVLRHACAQIRAWQDQGLQVAVAVNLSARHFGSDQALRLVEEALRDSGIPAALLEIEVTENVFIRNAAAAREALDGLHALGVRVALDDFGTGYSSLSYLRHLPFDALKIDRAFMRDLRLGESSGRIVETIIGLAHALDAKVVAEGVETPEQLAVLRQLGCDAVQGFLLGRPMTPDAMAALILGQPKTTRRQSGEAAA